MSKLLYTEKVSDYRYNLFYCNGVQVGEILMKEDGFFDWWPEQRGGYLPSHFLRAVAEILDEMNAPYEAELERFFEAQCIIGSEDVPGRVA